MKHLVVGDNHGFHHNLRKLLLAQGVINKKGAAINRDEYKVYCTGDLIDGDVNQAGDILNLELMPEWFDAVCLGNHEYAFLGGRDFGGRRKNDRTTTKLLLDRLDEGILVPSLVVNGYLLCHAGFSKEFDFRTAEDANEFIHSMWNAAPEISGTIAIFDWKNNQDYSTYGDPTSGIFNLAWKKDRNRHFSQVVGHTILPEGPIKIKYGQGVTHWNIDTGAKHGQCIGGIIIDDETNEVTPVHWGKRAESKKKTTATTYNYSDTYDGSGKNLPVKWNGKDRGLTTPSDTTDKLSSSTLKVGMILLADWGTTYRVVEINRGSQNVVLKDVNNNSHMLNKPLNSDWMLKFKIKDDGTPKNPIVKIPLADMEDIAILGDPDVMRYFREEVNRT